MQYIFSFSFSNMLKYTNYINSNCLFLYTLEYISLLHQIVIGLWWETSYSQAFPHESVFGSRTCHPPGSVNG